MVLLRYLLFLNLFITSLLLYSQEETTPKNIQKWRESRVKESKDGWIFPYEADLDANLFPDNWARSENYYLEDGKTLARASWAEIYLDGQFKKEGNYSLFFLHEGEQDVQIETDVFKINNFAAYEISSWFYLEPESTFKTQVTMGVLWYDKDKNLLEKRSEDFFVVKNTTGWEKFKQRINLLYDDAVYAKLYINVSGNNKKAKIWIDETKFYKRPRITINTGKNFHVFDEKEVFNINLNFKGLEKAKYFLDVTMINPFDSVVYHNTHEIDLGHLSVDERREYSYAVKPVSKFSFIDPKRPDRNYLEQGVFTTSIILRDEVEEIGGNSLKISRTKKRVRVPMKENGEIFGVGVGSIDKTYLLREGLDLVGAMRVKVPIWEKGLEVDGNQLVNNDSRNNVINLLKSIKVGENQPQVIGMFSPRPKIIQDVAEPGFFNLIKVNQDIWNPFIKGSIESFGPRINAYQLGDDDDKSFKSKNDIIQDLDKLTTFDIMNWAQIGCTSYDLYDPEINDDLRLLKHKWIKFYNFKYEDDMNFNLIDQLLEGHQNTVGTNKWLTIPIKSNQLYQDQLGASIDLFKKVVRARSHNVERIFVNPYQSEFNGLINLKEELSPSFLAYKLAIDHLSDVKYMGSLPEFGEDIENFVFSLNQNPKKAILVAWTKRSDDVKQSYSFDEKELLLPNRRLEDLEQELLAPDVINGLFLKSFLGDLDKDNNRSHFVKNLNHLLADSDTRKKFLKAYDNMGIVSKNPYTRKLILNKHKSEDEEIKTVRYILEEIYPANINKVDVVQKDILLDQEVSRIDIMGNEKLEKILFTGDKYPYQEIKIDQYPTIFTGLNRSFINTRISIRLDPNTKIYSRLTRQKQSIFITNHYDQPMEGLFIVNFPPTWKNFDPFKKFRIDKGKTEVLDFWVIPSRVARPGPVTVGLNTEFSVESKYRFKSKRVIELESDLIVGRPGEPIEIVPPKFGDTDDKYQLSIPISLKPASEDRPASIDVLVTLDLPQETPRQTTVEKVQNGNFKSANFGIKLKKEYKNKKAKIRIEQRGSSNESLIFYNLEVPIPDE